jgi:hypothetical protein
MTNPLSIDPSKPEVLYEKNLTLAKLERQE